MMTEIFYIVVIGVIIFITFMLCHDYISGKYEDHFFLVACIGYVIFIISHFYMSIQLNDVKNEFIHVATNEDSRVQIKSSGGESYRALDYNGQIDTVLEQRDILLSSKHYKMFGSWNLQHHPGGGVSTSTSGIYIWIPFF